MRKRVSTVMRTLRHDARVLADAEQQGLLRAGAAASSDMVRILCQHSSHHRTEQASGSQLCVCARTAC